jgi:hypothetical protein
MFVESLLLESANFQADQLRFEDGNLAQLVEQRTLNP